MPPTTRTSPLQASASPEEAPDTALADDWTLDPGKLSLAISTAVVGLLRARTGRGPAKARTIIQADLVVVLLEGLLTKPEVMLVESGRSNQVLELRDTIQAAIREELIEVVERLTGRTVKTLIAANHATPDLAAQLFMLEPDS